MKVMRTAFAGEHHAKAYGVIVDVSPTAPPENIMKNQALTITLAILLAVSLSAIAALVISSEVAGNTEVVATTPAPIQIEVINPAPSTEAPTAASDTATNPAPSTGADAAPTDNESADNATNDGATNDGATNDGAASTDDDDAPADDQQVEDTTDDAAGTDDEDDVPTDDGDDDEVPTDDEDDGVPTDDEDDDDEPTDDDDISILCKIGYELVDQDCVFVGCPLGMVLQGDTCKPLVFETPCPDGQIRLANGACIELGLTLPEADPLCPAGFTAVNGDCDITCPEGLMPFKGLCIPEVEIDVPEFNPDFALSLDLSS